MSRSVKQDYPPKREWAAQEISLAMPDEFPEDYAEYLAEKETA
jgi:hypothetical protein